MPGTAQPPGPFSEAVPSAWNAGVTREAESSTMRRLKRSYDFVAREPVPRGLVAFVLRLRN